MRNVFAYMLIQRVCVCGACLRNGHKIYLISISSELCATPFRVSFLTFEMNEENNGDDSIHTHTQTHSRQNRDSHSPVGYGPKAICVRMLSQTTNNAINDGALWPARACSPG